MDSLTIEGIPVYNGEYPLDMSYFTNRELNLIKTVSGVRAGELSEAFEAGDNDLMVAIAAIAIWRSKGEKPNMDPLWDAAAGKFTFNIEDTEAETEDESLPPPTEPDEPDRPSENLTVDGVTSSDGSGLPANGRNSIGAPV
jgi:hypothetical protein